MLLNVQQSQIQSKSMFFFMEKLFPAARQSPDDALFL